MPTEDGLEYALRAKDEISGPAKSASSSLRELTGELKNQDAALKSHGAAHHESGLSVKEHGGILKEFGGEVSGLVPGLGAAAAALTGFAAAAALAIEGVKMAVEMSEFKENATQAYSVVLGTAEEGERTFAELDKIARNIHMPAEKAHTLAQSLLLEGLKGQEALTGTVEAVGNLQRVGLGAGAEKLQMLIARGLAQGGLKLSAKQLAGTGVSIDALTSDLAVRLHQSTATIKEELKKGTIDVETGVEAITSEINKGKIGALATKKFTIADAFTDMQNKIRGVFQETNSGPLTDAFKKISESFSETGEGADNLKEGLNSLIELSGGIVGLAGALATGLVDGFNAAVKAAKGLWHEAEHGLDALKSLSGFIDKTFNGGKGAAYAAAGEKDVEKREDKELRGRIEKAKLDTMFAAGQPGASKETIDMAKKLGADVIVDGVVQGIQSKGDAPAGAMKVGMLDSVDAAKKALRAHAPSRAMFDLGGDATEGFALGADRGADRARDALSSATIAPTLQGRDTGGGGKHVSLEVHFGDVHGVANAEDMHGIVENAMADVLERIQLELGQ